MSKTCIPVAVVCLAQLLLVSYVIGSTSFKVAIVNNDFHQTDGTCKYTHSCSLRNISCWYMHHFKKQPISAEFHSHLDTTVRAFQNSELDVSAVLYFNENFTDAFVAKMALGDEADAETVDVAHVHVWVREAEPVKALKQYLQTTFDHFSKDIITKCDFTRDSDRFAFGDPYHYHSVAT